MVIDVDPQPGTGPGTLIMRLKTLSQGLKSVLDVVRNAPQDQPLTPEMQQQVLQIRQHMSKLARTCADMMDFVPNVFQGFDFTGADLRADEEEVRTIEEFMSFVTEAMNAIQALFNQLRTRMARRALSVVGQFRAYREMPVRPAGIGTEVEQAWLPIEKVLNDASTAVQDVKSTHEDLRLEGDRKEAAADARFKAADLERNVLRGQRLDPEQVAAAAPKPPPDKKRKPRKPGQGRKNQRGTQRSPAKAPNQ